MTRFDQSTGRPDFAVPQARPGLSGIATAFKRAVVSQCHPRMLLAILLPFVIMLVGAVLLLYLFWTPLTDWLTLQADQWTLIRTVDEWLVAIGVLSLKVWIVPLVATFILLPIAGIIGVAVAAVFVMPMVVRHVADRGYPGLARLGRNATLLSVWNAIWVLTVFAVGWLVTMPLWLFPPLGIALSVFWWTFAFSRLMRVDAIVEHASPEERKRILRQNNTGFWTLGLICSLLNLLPPAWLILPVFSALLFAHYGLDVITRERATAQQTLLSREP